MLSICLGLVSALQAFAAPNILFIIADDWSQADAGIYGNKVIQTPHIDQLGREGLVFQNAFCASPSCTPSRAAILTGRYPHQLEQGGNLWSFLPAKFDVYPDLLEKAGYSVGHTRKGWGPGNFKAGGRERNPAGPNFRNFAEFLQKAPKDKPFAFWFGSQDPHRPYVKGLGKQLGLDPSKVTVPPYWPDTPEVREDILDYYAEVQRFDSDIGELLAALEKSGRRDDTLIVVTSDNGMPFPRAKANLYDAGTRMPLIFNFPGKIKPGTSDAFVTLADLAPTFLELAGLKPAPDLPSRSLVPILQGKSDPQRDHVFLERERHANVRKGDLSYPARAIRTKDFLYIRNLRPERWPAGDPEMHKAVGPFGDCDNSPTKSLILENERTYKNPYAIHCFHKRPVEELYDLASDPHQVRNCISDSRYAKQLETLRGQLDNWMHKTADPRVDPSVDPWSHYEYFGGPDPMPASSRK